MPITRKVGVAIADLIDSFREKLPGVADAFTTLQNSFNDLWSRFVDLTSALDTAGVTSSPGTSAVWLSGAGTWTNAQTPWNSDIDGGSFNITNLTGISGASGLTDITGAIQVHPSGTAPDNGYNGSVRITKPTASGQYINLVRVGTNVWSIGTVYNTSVFAIGPGQATDSAFTAPPFVIDLTGHVGIGTTTPTISGTGLLHVAGDTVRICPTARTPASSAAAGNDGEFCVDSTGHLYIHSGGSWYKFTGATF